MKMKRSLILISIFLILCSTEIYAQDGAYSFFIAGHVYGAPSVENLGFHPPFKAKFEYIQSRSEIEFGILLGDVVPWGSYAKWDNVDAEIDTLGLPVYIAVGNHDLYNAYIYYERYGDTYFSFIHNCSI